VRPGSVPGVSDSSTHPSTRRTRPGLTACSLCAGETLGTSDPLKDGQLARLRALHERGVADLTLSECLDECERGDVVVARPSPAGRRLAGRPVWFERLAGDALTEELAAWLECGGPGCAAPPAALVSHQIRRSEADGRSDP
jgi:(2Fe-2S) ferredoxin